MENDLHTQRAGEGLFKYMIVLGKPHFELKSYTTN